MRSVRIIAEPQAEDLLPKLQRWCQRQDCFLFFNRNNYPHPAFSQQWLLACGRQKTFSGPADVLSSLYNEHQHHRDWYFGYISYDYRLVLEPKSSLLVQEPAHVPFESIFFFRPRHVLQRTGEGLIIESLDEADRVWSEIQATAAADSPAVLPVSWTCDCDLPAYRHRFAQIKSHLAAGDIYEINYCIEFLASAGSLNPWWVMQELCRHAPAPFACLLRHDDRYAIGASPERFLRRSGNRIIAQPMKGTAPRTRDNKPPVLQQSPKEQAENVMIVDLMRNDLSRCAVSGSVVVDELFGIYPFPHLWQMISTVSGTLRPDIPFTDALRFTFPPGSMTGAPKVKAMQLIERLEPRSRGLYSGIIGYIDPNGDFDFHVVIRTLMYDASRGVLSLHAGSGVTWYAHADEEYRECLLKARSVLKPIPGFRLAGC